MRNFSSEFIGLFNKIAKFDKSLNIHFNGADNNYPEIVESVISESVTASRCAKLMASYISGKGFGVSANKVMVHKEKETSLLQLAQEIADSISEHNGFFIHANFHSEYNDYTISDLELIPFSNCRIGKKDDNKYAGKILVCDDWGDPKKARKAKPVDIYNPIQKVIASQVKAQGGIEKYNGQIFYFKFGKYTYPLAPIHPALKDAESETHVAVYKNVSLRKGFFGKTLVVTKPLVDATLKGHDDDEYRSQLNERDAFRKTISDFIGAENAEGVMHIELEMQSDKLEDEIFFKNVESNIDDKLFAHTENSVSDNIRMCFNNVPAPLIRSQDGAMFGSSGEAINAMKVFYQDQTNDERMILEEVINKLMKDFHEPQIGLKLIPLIGETVEVAEKNVNDVDK